MFDWSRKIQGCLESKKGLSEFSRDVIDFFYNVFEYTFIPSEAYFSASSKCISLMTGRIFLGAYVPNGTDKGIWLLIDKEMYIDLGVNCKIVKSTKTSKRQLYWLHIPELRNLKYILENKEVWNSFKVASGLVKTSSTHGQYGKNTENKSRLDTFWNEQDYDSFIAEEVQEYDNNILLLKEGVLKQIVVNAYERNPRARKACIDYYGTYKCQICDFDFEKEYGELGKNFIHVHHIKPLSKIKSGYEVNPINDLIPVCPNCHSMLHRKANGNEELSISELKKLLKK